MSDRAVATFDLATPATVPVRCAACANQACEALEGVPGVFEVTCDPVRMTVQVAYDPARVSESDLAVEMEAFGLERASSVRHAAWRVTGLD